MLRGALAGVTAAATWAAVEPLAGKVFRPPPGYSDVRLLGAVLTRDGAGWRAAGLGVHLANGAVFGALFARAGGRGPGAGLAAAQLENLALWPGMAVVDRIHPDRRGGAWPRLLTNPRVLAYEAAVHAVFGVVLGALLTGGSPGRRPA